MGWAKQNVHGSLTDVDINKSNAIKVWKSGYGRGGYPDTSARYPEDKAVLFALSHAWKPEEVERVEQVKEVKEVKEIKEDNQERLGLERHFG